MTRSERLSETIKEIVIEQLAPVQVVDLVVREDVDHDGDEILRVEVVVEVDGDRLDPERVMGLVRHLREPLQMVHEERFPVFTFVKPGELDGAAA